MESLFAFLGAAGTMISMCKGTYDICAIVRRHLASLRKNAGKEVLAFLYSLGCRSDHEIRHLVENWAPPVPLTEEKREELITLLINLAHGARAHTTRGTLTSGFSSCAELIDLLLANMQPRRQRGEAVGVGWAEWKLEKFLGMGSFGEVWLGRNVGFHEPEAFKFFTQDGARDWLSQEQQALNHIGKKLGKHPNIIEFKNVVIADQQWPFLVLEYVGGGSLEEWILSKPEDRAPLNKQAIVEGIVAGLASAHKQEIFHRDLKPANVMLTAGPDSQAKIGDFGLGQVGAETSQADEDLRSQGMVVGTNMYLPPEALEPLAERNAAQDDVFALGVLWYQLEVERLERPPYDFAEQLQQKGLHAHTVRLISRCLAHPRHRFTDACALEDALKGVVPDDTAWKVPEGCFDVRDLAREYLCSLTR
jgi:hypothetical protein